jgi:hypothetical protein
MQIVKKELTYNLITTITLFTLVVAVSFPPSLLNIKTAMAATLTSVGSVPTSNVVTTKASYEILFTTATTGIIKTIAIAFPTGFLVDSAILIERSGIGQGTLSANDTTLIYTVTSPVSISKGIPIRLEFANIIHPGTADNYSISITTKNSSGNPIDGPTTSISPIVKIGTPAIADRAVGHDQLGISAVTASNINPTFMHTTILHDDANGNARGWNPGECMCAQFNIFDASVVPGASISLTLSHGALQHDVVCGVEFVGNPFHISCFGLSNGVPAKGTTLIYTVMYPQVAP